MADTKSDDSVKVITPIEIVDGDVSIVDNDVNIVTWTEDEDSSD